MKLIGDRRQSDWKSWVANRIGPAAVEKEDETARSERKWWREKRLRKGETIGEEGVSGAKGNRPPFCA